MSGELKYSINVQYRHRKTGLVTHKQFIISSGEENVFESILRSSFSIPSDEGLLLHCNETIFYPIGMIDVHTAASAAACELQSFPLAAMNDITAAKGESRPAKKSKKSNTAENPTYLNDNSKEDKRRFNRGLDQRRSYLKEEKIFVMIMKDAGKTADDISHLTGVSKSNVEKWCSEKVREKMLVKFRQEMKHPVIDESLRENPLHFSTKEPAKFKILLEVLAERLHLAQNHQQVAAGTYQIPPSIFWKVSSHHQQHQADRNSGRKQFHTIYSPDSAIQYVLNQGYFFKKKNDKDSVSSGTTHEKESFGREDDDGSMEGMYKNEAITTDILDQNQASIDLNLSNLPQHMNTFISSEESDMMDFALDDQSIASSQWIIPGHASTTGHASSALGPVNGAGPFPPAVPTVDTMPLLPLEEDDIVTDDDLDCDEIDSLLSVDMNGAETKPVSALDNPETLQLLIRQGVVPAIKPNKVCSRPVECREELIKLLRDTCQESATRFVKSDCTMQFRGRIQCTVPVRENQPNQTIAMAAIVPLHATRGVLRNTKYLSAIRESLSGKVYTEEEEEDAAVLSLLGE